MNGVEAVGLGAVQKPAELDWLLTRVTALDPRVICEIGVDTGGTFQALEAACPDATLIGVDVGEGRWASGPLFADPRVIRGDSHDPVTTRELVKRLAGRRIDFLLIDGDHSFDGVAEDYWTYLPLARWAALHDVADHAAGSDVQVADFWRRIRHRHPDAEVFISEPESWGGYAFFEVSDGC